MAKVKVAMESVRYLSHFYITMIMITRCTAMAVTTEGHTMEVILATTVVCSSTLSIT